jgi:hypothetical protein
MTRFEFRKTSKTALENRVEKDTRTKTEEDLVGELAWRIRSPRGDHCSSRGTIPRGA